MSEEPTQQNPEGLPPSTQPSTNKRGWGITEAFFALAGVVLLAFVAGLIKFDDGSIQVTQRSKNIFHHVRALCFEEVSAECTPSGWVRIETKRYSYAVPENWSRKSDRDFDTYAEESDSGNSIFGIRGPRDGESLSQIAKQARAGFKKNEDVTDFTELSPFTVATSDDASRKVFPSVHALGGKSIQYLAVIDIGKDEALAFVITYTSTQDQVAMREFSEQVLDTFVVKD